MILEAAYNWNNNNKVGGGGTFCQSSCKDYKYSSCNNETCTKF